MGIKDNSWCGGCGESIPFTADQNAECGKCEKETAVNFIESYIAYMTNHLAELEEELSQYADMDTNMVPYLEGAVETTGHLLAKLVDRYQNA